MFSRPFWAGLGLGIMAGALLLQLLLAGQAGEPLPDPPPDAVYTAEEADLLVQAAVERAKAEMAEAAEAAASSGPQAEPEPSLPPSGSPKLTPSAPPAASPPKAEAKPSATPSKKTAAVVIRIEPGSSLTDTASLLKKHGLIASEKGFLDYMEKQRPVPLVRAGYFKIEGKPGLGDLKAILAGQPMDPGEGKAWLDKQER
ncbi:endolytic transglycosylase MltG [Paenibacillus albicereus]|uniref:Endolytic transglycosylase MltG n=1 Tax=Paenibacillus albicereus TaxID=2726185 RepID=A0A6H2GYR5_9BACL|nr:endolytic transglycosylase MltG [Paenibacillus albicereus]QJC52258.1 endolytic transglycosylase MltG [Paenibacillus albicereus]